MRTHYRSLSTLAALLIAALGALPACSAAQDEGTEGAEELISGVQATSDATNAYYVIPYQSTPTWVRLYLDTDRNSGTAYRYQGIGAELLIENGNLYRYAGTGGTNWAWTFVKKVSFTRSASAAQLTVARADLGSPASLDLVAQTDPPTQISPKITQTFDASTATPTPSPAPAPSGTGGQVTYAENTATIPNPERGFYRDTNCASALSQTTLQGYRTSGGDTLLHCYIYLTNFLTSPISQAQLDTIQNNMNLIRNAGLKTIPRFAYTQSTTGNDASKSIVLTHLSQLAPILANNKDIIATVQVGFVGAWGEWGYSQNFGFSGSLSSQNWTDRKDVLEKLLSVLPVDRTVQLRTPDFKTHLYGTTALSASEAFSGTSRARIGQHNDCFLANSSDAGTYTNTSVDYPWLATETKYLPMGGETCAVSSPRSDCPTALNEMAMFHWSYINLDYNQSVINNWKSQGCFDQMKQRLGYRFVLKSGSYSATAKPGGGFTASFTLQNRGFASTYNRRNVELVFRNTSGGATYAVKLAADPRTWLPGSDINVNETVTLPAGMTTGNYELLLHLADPEASLASRPEYAIQLANTGLWEANTGFNKLNATVSVAP